MNNTLKDGDFGFTYLIDSHYERFDIVSVDTGEGKIIKRIVGLPGENLVHKEGKLYVNGKRIKEPFISKDNAASDFKIKLGKDEYYLLGDNRIISKDSRFYGPFKKEDINGKWIKWR